MPLFKCENCGCIENTALCYYWNTIDEKLCSECDPELGKWHGAFEKKSAKGMKIGNDGFLYFPEEIESDSLKFRMKHQGFKIIGEVEWPSDKPGLKH